MAIDKAKRSNPLAQPNARRSPNPQLKAQLLDSLQHLNRGYGIALSNLNRLEHLDKKGKPGIFPAACLRNLLTRTEELRAVANHELLHTLAGREGQEAIRFGRLRIRQEKRSTRQSQ
jgi:hypothetical protein